MKSENLQVLNRDTIKYIAVFAMLLNHISNAFLERGTFWGELFLDIGYFTAPVMCYFLVEGYYYTRSGKKYGLRLLIFALISQQPYYMALWPEMRWPGILNMMFTLFICFLILEVKHHVRQEACRWLLYAVLIGATNFCDWPVMAGVYTLLFADAYGSPLKMRRAFCIAMAVFVMPMYATNSMLFPVGKAAFLTGCAALGVLAAGAAVLYLYNGRQAKRGKIFSKWFFYLFYPAHLFVIGMIRAFFI